MRKTFYRDKKESTPHKDKTKTSQVAQETHKRPWSPAGGKDAAGSFLGPWRDELESGIPRGRVRGTGWFSTAGAVGRHMALLGGKSMTQQFHFLAGRGSREICR